MIDANRENLEIVANSSSFIIPLHQRAGITDLWSLVRADYIIGLEFWFSFLFQSSAELYLQAALWHVSKDVEPAG